MIAVALVTFNRKELLLRTIESVLNQTHKVDKIFLLNNASTDGTELLLREKGYLNHPQIVYKYSEINEGGAGGFHEAMKLAYEAGARWIWTMDDDIVVSPEALETMLSYQNSSLCIHPSKQFENGKRFIWEGYFDSTTGRSIWVEDGFLKNKEYSFVNYACFEGMLVHRSIVEKVGYPDKRFFICYDDLIFGWLASFYTNIIYLNKVLITRTIPEAQKKNPKAISNYYVIRNMFLIYEYLKNKSPRFNPWAARVFFMAKALKVLFEQPCLFQSKLFFWALRDGFKGKFYKLEM